MDVNWAMIIAVEEKSETVLLENLRHAVTVGLRIEYNDLFPPIVPDEESPLASGMSPGFAAIHPLSFDIIFALEM